ncbi:hypothetical protein DPV78_004777 [Talaromyces pinophilus]|nr:hypothetical protein DPV78_004777 [Talaromyces pinophilus]
MFSTIKLERTALLLTSLIAVLTPSLSAVALANQTCYYPDGSIAQGDKPCGNGTDVACCGSGGICLSNGLCMDVAQPNTLARSSCTDKTWNSGNCPNYCLQGLGVALLYTGVAQDNCILNILPCADTSFNKSGCSIILFSYLDSTAEYCCNNMDASDNTPICASNYSTFQIPDSNIVPGYALLSDYTTISNATSSTGSCPNGDHHVAVGVGVGVGVGVPLGLIALASIAWALRERRKLNRYKAETLTSAKTPSPYSDAAPPQQQAYNMAPLNAGAYGQPAQTYNHNDNQHSPAMLSEMGTRGPVELDSRK